MIICMAGMLYFANKWLEEDMSRLVDEFQQRYKGFVERILGISRFE